MTESQRDTQNRMKRAITERIPLILGIAFGIFSFFFLLLFSEGGDGHAARAYWLAAKGLVSDGQIYGFFPGYRYTPITILLFVPYAYLPFSVVFVVQAVTAVLAAGGLGILTISHIEDQGRILTQAERGLVLSFFLISSLSIPAYMQAQVNTHLALLIAIGFVAFERDRDILSGSAFAIAALFKAIPAIFGLWLLYRQGYRAVLTSISVGVTGLLLGVLLFGMDTTVIYFEILLTRAQIGNLASISSPETAYLTLKQPLAHFLPGLGDLTLTVLNIAPLILVVGFAFRYDQSHSTVQSQILSILAISIAMLAGTLSYFYYSIYIMFPLVASLFLIENRITKSLLGAGTALLVAIFTAEDVAAVVQALPVPASLSDLIINISYIVMSIAPLPLLGVLSILVAMVYYYTQT